MPLPSSVPSPAPNRFITPIRSIPPRTRGIHAFLKVVRSVYRAQHRRPQFEAVCVEWIERFLRHHAGTPLQEITHGEITTFLAENANSPTVGSREEREAQEALHFLWVDVLSRCQS